MLMMQKIQDGWEFGNAILQASVEVDGTHIGGKEEKSMLVDVFVRQGRLRQTNAGLH